MSHRQIKKVDNEEAAVFSPEKMTGISVRNFVYFCLLRCATQKDLSRMSNFRCMLPISTLKDQPAPRCSAPCGEAHLQHHKAQSHYRRLMTLYSRKGSAMPLGVSNVAPLQYPPVTFAVRTRCQGLRKSTIELVAEPELVVPNADRKTRCWT